MKILYSPQINEIDVLEYEFVGDKITVTYNGEIDEYDFTDMPDGSVARSYGREPEIISNLPINPVIEAKRMNGILHVILIKFIPFNATEDKKFPDWIEVGTDG